MMSGQQSPLLENVPSRKRGTPLSKDEKWMVIKVFSRCDEERRDTRAVPTGDAHSRTAHYTGVGRRQVVEIVRHFKDTGEVVETPASGNRSVHATNVPSLVEPRIRDFILQRHLGGEICNANHIQDLLQQCLGRTIPARTIRHHLNRMGFSYSRTKKKTRSLREQAHVRQQRHSYLYTIKQLRQAGYQPVYLDESFIHHYHGNQFSWFNDDLGDYLERPAGKGRRWCFIHAMSATGLVAGAWQIFEAKKRTGDYHQMFNAYRFQHWWQEQLLPNLPTRCVIVMDRVPFHLVPEAQIIPQALRKAELQHWLTAQHIPWQADWLKPKLLEVVMTHLNKTPIVEKMATAQGHRVLVLPVHHPELNPIELVWAIIKNECGRLLRQGVRFSEVREHLERALEKITAATCDKVYDNILQQEQVYWDADMAIDNIEDDTLVEGEQTIYLAS